ncbi:U-box domain-containing protein 4 [Magnolia sinica]|uniref:U-box domain-containing protein 4 n=1 Tax=Magnolia sinica TaxID=86752 RepID=UPI00265AE9DD|nr:U-box domain-containing protein 4 [Magnolia sinica]XP_058070716.1 U-box domain-containing protein 4 [Magnolia sinica]
MVSLAESHSRSPQQTPSSTPQRPQVRSMRTIRSTLFQSDHSSSSFTSNSHPPPSIAPSTQTIDFTLQQLATKHSPYKPSPEPSDLLDLSQAFSDFSAYSSDISGELQRLAAVPPGPDDPPPPHENPDQDPSLESFVQPGDLESIIESCVGELGSLSIDMKRRAAAKLRLLAKNRPENRALIGSSGAIPVLIPLLRCGDPMVQEHAVTALLNLSLHEENKVEITQSGAIKPLIFVLKTGTSVSKQNAACALLSLSLVEDNKITIGACGAIPPLVSLLLTGSNRGKKDALTTLYKLCSVQQNKERAVNAGAVRPLVGLVGEQGSGTMEKAMVVLSSLAGIPGGRTSIVEESGIPVLVEAIEGASGKGREFAVLTLLQLCADSMTNRGLLVREGGIPPLVALSQSGTARAKHKAETLLRYLREQRQDASCSSP